MSGAGRGAIALAVAAVGAILFTSAPASADPGDPSPTWVPDGAVNAVAVSGSTAYIGGNFSRIAPYTGGSVALDPVSGERRSTWPDVAGRVNAAASDGAGGWYIGGHFTSVGGAARQNLAHVLANGTVDPAWAPAADSEVYALAVRGSKVYAGGHFTAIDGTQRAGLAQLDGATGVLTSFSAGLAVVGGRATVYALALGGTRLAPILFVGGTFNKAGGAARSGLASFSADGSVTGFDPQVAGQVNDIVLEGTVLYAGGRYQKVNGTVDRTALAAFDRTSGTVSGWNPSIVGPGKSVAALDLVGSTLYAVGLFGLVNDGTAHEAQRGYAAAFDATTAKVTSWNPQLTGAQLGAPGQAIEVVGQTAYLAGDFTLVNGTRRRGLAAVDKDSGSLLPWDPSPNGDVTLVTGDQSELVVGGSFHSIGGVDRSNVAAIDLETGQPTAFAANVGGSVHALAVGENGLWVGGDFPKINGLPQHAKLANLDPLGAPLPFSQQLDGPVRALALVGSTVYAGGEFGTVNQTTVRRGVAAFQAPPGTTGVLLTFDAGANGPVRALASAHGRVYLGGEFSMLNGGAVTRNNLAAVDPVTGKATAWDPNADKPVRALTTLGQTVIAAGPFTTVNGTTQRRGIAMLDADSGAATAWDPAPDGPVHALATDGEQVFAGGSFTQAGGSPRTGLAALDAATGTAASWSPTLAYPDVRPVDALAATPNGWLVAGGGFVVDRGPVRSARLAAFALPPAPQGTDGPSTTTPPGTTPPDTGQPGTSADTLAPSLSRFALTPKRFRVAAAATPLAAGVAQRSRTRAAARGSRLRFTLSEPGDVRVVIERARPGRRVGPRCQAPTRKRRGLRRCTRFTRAGTLIRRQLRAGPNAIRFSGRIGRRALAVGRYRASVTATDTAGNRSTTRRGSFSVVRR